MSYGQYNNNPYAQAPAAEGGYGYDQGQQHGGNNQYEMQSYGQQQQSGGPATISQQDYLSRVQYLRNEIRSLTSDIEHIAQLHQRALASTDVSSNQQLNQAVSQTQVRNTAITNEIKFLERDAARTTDSSRASKQAQLNSVRKTFQDELQKYMQMESDYQRRYKDQIARQYRIVNPDASEQEVQQATEADWGNEGVFQTALKSNHLGQANSVLGNVRARHSELKRIEQTLAEVAQLFQEMAVLVEQQEPVVDAAEQNAQSTVENLQKGNEQVEVANKHARNRRKLKWWCLLVVVLILLAIGLGVGLGIHFANNATN
ncbi:t-SNARE [Sodiomyces alkalinus F11]|uniref:t-SNARE n=1 Tax=Sodiomyces alkalinus (strain CBS 110278 / VKM F-3762 / F11) TaxID=1314773 RepID=A0A3N2PLY8_SODAK|nr:t-SNARE [Sodiomyces alkalinus F11]ROT35528.1 t-SNARE [Sodiomyces alkalinus F11]